MALLRKASAYSKRKVRPYTRQSNVQSKSYIKTVPNHKIVKFKMGDIKRYDKEGFNYVLKLKSLEKVQIRDNALEAVRQLIHKAVDKELAGNYYFEVKPFPHHILRENKMLTGAGADRMQSGMQQSFGKASGRAAIVKPGKEILIVAVPTQKSTKTARHALQIARAKLPCKTKIIMEKKK